MMERPIIFSTPMVRAILDGRKTQTRRVMKQQPSEYWSPARYGEVHKMIDGYFPMRHGAPIQIGWGPSRDDGEEAYPCPYGKPGDRLWVRETWREWTIKDGECDCDTCPGHRPPSIVCYRAENGDCDWSKWRPSIFMPRKYSRILLEITNIRVEQLQDISESDAIAEGVEGDNHPGTYIGTHRGNFSRLWNSINEKRGYGWDTNPWTWAITFKRVK